jgi:DNA-binding IclR family transcriptional regulator
MSKNAEEPWRKLKTVEDALDIVEVIGELNGAGVSEIASHLDVSRSSIHSHLVTLEQRGYLIKENGEYRLSWQFLILGESVRNNSLLFRFGRQHINELVSETGHYGHLYTEEAGRGVNIYETRGTNAEDYDYQTLKLQQREPMHITASGKAVLAFLDKDRVEEIIATHGLDEYTKNTITEKATLFDELETIHEQGYAVNDEEEITGFRAVAAPVLIEQDEVLGSVSVAGPKTFLSGETLAHRIPDRIKTVANMIEVEINMSSHTRVQR